MTSSRRTAYLAIVLALVASLLAGCGSGSDDGSTGGSTEAIQTSNLSKTQWIKKAEETCGTGTLPILEKVTAYEEKHSAKTTQETEAVAGKAIKQEVPPIMDALAKDLRGLGAPAGDEEQVTAFLVALEKDNEGIATGPLLTGLGDIDEQYGRSGKLALQYGLVGCAFG